MVYIVETDAGQETLSPEDFEKKYGWNNDPDQVRLTAVQAELKGSTEKRP